MVYYFMFFMQINGTINKTDMQYNAFLLSKTTHPWDHYNLVLYSRWP